MPTRAPTPSGANDIENVKAAVVWPIGRGQDRTERCVETLSVCIVGGVANVHGTGSRVFVAGENVDAAFASGEDGDALGYSR